MSYLLISRSLERQRLPRYIDSNCSSRLLRPGRQLRQLPRPPSLHLAWISHWFAWFLLKICLDFSPKLPPAKSEEARLQTKPCLAALQLPCRRILLTQIFIPNRLSVSTYTKRCKKYNKVKSEYNKFAPKTNIKYLQRGTTSHHVLWHTWFTRGLFGLAHLT